MQLDGTGRPDGDSSFRSIAVFQPPPGVADHAFHPIAKIDLRLPSKKRAGAASTRNAIRHADRAVIRTDNIGGVSLDAGHQARQIPE
jgi:hypothetical protein